MRETDPPQLVVDLSAVAGSVDEVLATGSIPVRVETNEASSYDVTVLVGDVSVGSAAVPLHEWGREAPPGTPAPYAITIDVPIDDPLALAGGSMTIRVTARDRVMNGITVEESVEMVDATSGGPSTPSGAGPASGPMPSTGGGAVMAAFVLLSLATYGSTLRDGRAPVNGGRRVRRRR